MSWRVSLRSPAQDSAREYVQRSLLMLWLNDHLQGTLRDARSAGLTAAFDLFDHGLILRLDGLRQHQPLLLERMLASLSEDEIDAETFARVATRLREGWQAQTAPTPIEALSQATGVALEPDRWRKGERLAELGKIDLAQFQAWRTTWRKQLSVDALAVGNLPDSDAASIGQRLERQLQPVAPAQGIAFTPPRHLAPDLPLMRAQSSSRDSGLKLYWPFAERSLAHQADVMLIAQLIAAPYFQSLRTEQQTGYLVNASSGPDWQHPSLVLTVQSNAYRSDEIRRRSEAFLAGVGQRIAELDDSAMAKLRNAVSNGLDRPAKNAAAQVERYWADLALGDDSFTTRQQLSGLVAQRNKAQLLAAWQALQRSPALWIAVDPGEKPNLQAFTRTVQRLEWN